ncbi:MAG: hypothetical protein HY000_25600 [Planctomycetes bacterium]|nr:hypothetical protein [Planctomycetia bacterium]MBI3466402.1 hypothetical protein [Planctomycetota bacterium]
MISIHAPWTEVEPLVDQALKELRSDVLLFQLHANERSITHRLALYLEQPFLGWNVDCEYSRIGEDPSVYKKLVLPEDDRLTHFDADGSRVYPDIVIHNRGHSTPNDNLLVIEVKTTWSQVSDQQDFRKLSAFIGVYPVDQLLQYRFGLFLRFGEDAAVISRRLFENEARK